jgi:superfamily II DNA or RNA helicase
MGTGKTHYAKELAKTYNFKRILIVSPRKSFSLNKTYEFREIFSDFKDYTELTCSERINWLKNKKLAIQFESLIHNKPYI